VRPEAKGRRTLLFGATAASIYPAELGSLSYRMTRPAKSTTAMFGPSRAKGQNYSAAMG
jgi:hypothetical protein